MLTRGFFIAFYFVNYAKIVIFALLKIKKMDKKRTGKAGKPATLPIIASTILTELRERRILLGISQEEMAEKLGICDQTYLSRLENGRLKMHIGDIEKYAEIVGLKLTLKPA